MVTYIVAGTIQSKSDDGIRSWNRLAIQFVHSINCRLITYETDKAVTSSFSCVLIFHKLDPSRVLTQLPEGIEDKVFGHVDLQLKYQ